MDPPSARGPKRHRAARRPIQNVGVAQEHSGERSHIVSRGDVRCAVAPRGHAVDRRVAGVVHPQRRGPRVHQLDAGRDRAEDALGHGHRGVVGRRYHHGAQQRAERKRLAPAQPDRAAPRPTGAARDDQPRFQIHPTAFDLFECDQRQHHFGQRRLRPDLVAAIGEQDLPGAGVLQEGGLESAGVGQPRLLARRRISRRGQPQSGQHDPQPCREKMLPPPHCAPPLPDEPDRLFSLDGNYSGLY